MANLNLGSHTIISDDSGAPSLESVNIQSSVTFPAGMSVKIQHYNSGYGSGARKSKSTQTWETLNIGGTNLSGPRKSDDNNVLSFTKNYNNSNLQINLSIPVYISPGGSGVGIRCKISTDLGSSYSIVDILDGGPAHGWGAFGYGGNTSGIINFTWNTLDKSSIASTIKSYTGDVYVFFEVYVWNSSDTAYFIDYDATYPKYGTFQIMEIMAEN